MRQIGELLLTLFGALVACGLIFVGFTVVALVPQVAFALAIERGGGPMMLVAATMFALGVLYSRVPRERALLLLVAALVFWMAMLRGFYWEIFEQGEGFFTSNRVSAIAAFIVVFCTPSTFHKLTEARMRKISLAHQWQYVDEPADPRA